ncbi:CcoQ/FixQ family Cbb3-type cytochrome c oxidase assembly chaperone [Zhengella mangrovi]|uniref:CcoQ/FixQ family Cbb3-type cytochrome c oxidase assembly chaperone n=1 Tax=Zhengella mangrovi TaxID=1982044 RepID=A0A2G1QLV9_9HYPH|nr:cbb3-type cytochrome c oxidase subunit 3 [Zhengella mangrovi]PHP66517.1 CcoQ/FixQ family Cbb3-type cytochrome c oxidase assembly chaperone [Zhengella mangrovi]
MDYHTMRAFADSWGLAFMCLVFVGVVAFVYLRPGSKRDAEEAARIPLQED